MLLLMLIPLWDPICPFRVLNMENNFQSHSLAHCIKVAITIEQPDSQSNCLIEQLRFYYGPDVIKVMAK